MSKNRDGWVSMRVGDLGRVVTGRTPPSEEAVFFGEDYPFITPGDLRQGKYTQVTGRSLSRAGAELLKRIMLPAESICVSCIGWQMGESIITSRASFSNQQINSIIADRSFDPSFIYYCFRTRKQELLSLGSAAGARTPIINKSTFCSLKIHVPPLSTQRRIASILGAYDELIEVNRRRIALLEEAARGIFEEWFVRFRYPGQDDQSLVESPEGLMPKCWSWKPLGSVFQVVLGGTPSRQREEYWKDGRIPWIGSAKANELRISEPSELITELGLRKSAAKLMPAGAVVVAITGATLGQLSVLLRPMAGNQSLVGVWDESSRRNEHLYRYLIHNVQRLTAHAGGAAQQHINKEIVERFLYLDPGDEIIDRFENVTRPIGDLTGSLILTENRLKAARDLLLPRLISGELSVVGAERELELAS